jgi:2-succinyl-5-enolpyruvyl-6-hydroxy-3-cyclohexene-1-carboxylate synthase
MEYTEALTKYVGNFIDELAQNGMTDVVISPGSRSTPLALTFAEHESIKEWVIIDERSAAFFALGMAKQTNRPVALVCTSGTAAANYLPAIVEAYYSRVPLVVLTGDRPHELRDVGAPQTIDQTRLYGQHVKWFHEMALPEGSESMLNYARSKAARAYYVAIEGNRGPVHLNFPFREPLSPDFTREDVWGEQRQASYHHSTEGKKRLAGDELETIVRKLEKSERGLIVCGPQTDFEVAEAIYELGNFFQVPILADPLSQLRSGHQDKANIIEGYNAILRSKAVRNKLTPDLIIRFGAMPVSKSYTFFIKENADIEQFVVENSEGFREPTGSRTSFLYADPATLCRDLIARADMQKVRENSWLSQWQSMNEVTKKHLFSGHEEKMTEGGAVRILMDQLPDHSSLYVGNSMAIRDVDTFYQTNSKQIELLANRGVNGIDGMVSSALGAAASGKKVTLLLGDLSFFHDMNGLLTAKHYAIDITILLVNNNGGGIFSFLPQANDPKHFELLFGTPANIDFSQAVNMYEGKYSLAETEEELSHLLEESYQHKGLHVIEVMTDREENKEWHVQKWQAIEKDILKGKDE